MIVGYAFVVADLLHFGHLHFLTECKKHCDFLIVGVYTDELTESYKRRPIIPFKERFELIKALRIVDKVVQVHNRDQTFIMKKLKEEGHKISCLFHGTDWDPKTDSDLKKSKEYIESVGGKLIQPEYYKERTTTLILQEIIEQYRRNKKINAELCSRVNRSIIGQRIVHSWAELFFLEQILWNNHFKRLIEIGTFEGGLSLFFGLHALRMDGKAVTLDILPEPTDKGWYGKLKPLLPIEFHKLDAQSEEAQKIIKQHISQGRTLLYCDGAEQRWKEFNLYCPLLKVDDIIMAHDRDNQMAINQNYAREIKIADIKEAIAKYHLKPFHDEMANQLGGIFSFIKSK